MNDQDTRLIKEQLGRIERQVDFLSYFAFGVSMGAAMAAIYWLAVILSKLGV